MGSDETVENSESNDSGVIEPEFLRQNKVQEKSYEMTSPPQRSYGINPIFAAHFKNSHFDQDSLDSNAVAAGSEFKYVKNTKGKKLQKTRKFHPKKSQSTDVVIESEISKEIGKLSVLRENETFAYNESCLI